MPMVLEREAQTAEDKFQKLRWNVEKRPLQYSYKNVSHVINKSALIRADNEKLLSIVPDHWNTFQNSDFIETVQKLINNPNLKQSKLEIVASGLYNDGEYVWLLVKSAQTFTLGKNDVVRAYYLFTNPHVYGASFSIQLMLTREITKTSLLMPFIKTSEKDLKLEGMQKILAYGDSQLKRYEADAKLLWEEKYNDDQLKDYLNTVFPTTAGTKQMSRPSIEVAKLVGTRLKIGEISIVENTESWWHVLNVIFWYFDHMAGNSVETRMFSNWYAKNRKIKLDALEHAVAFVRKSI
jgi:hypothetical protein